MKRIRIVQTAVLATVVVALVSCSSGRGYQTGYYPRNEPNVSLIIGGSPGLVMSRDPYGRTYYRDSYGRIYWRGNDNRFYLDNRYVNRSYYRHQQYNDWKRYNNNQRRRRY